MSPSCLVHIFKFKGSLFWLRLEGNKVRSGDSSWEASAMIRRRNECFSKKLNTELLYDPALPLLGIYPKETKTLIQKEIRTPTSIALFTVARIWKQPKHPSIKERIKKLIHTHTHTQRRILLSHEEECDFQHDGLGGYIAKWNNSVKEWWTLHDVTNMWNFKKYSKLVNINKRKQIHRYREQTHGYQCGEGKGRGNVGLEE